MHEVVKFALCQMHEDGTCEAKRTKNDYKCVPLYYVLHKWIWNPISIDETWGQNFAHNMGNIVGSIWVINSRRVVHCCDWLVAFKEWPSGVERFWHRATGLLRQHYGTKQDQSRAHLLTWSMPSANKSVLPFTWAKQDRLLCMRINGQKSVTKNSCA